MRALRMVPLLALCGGLLIAAACDILPGLGGTPVAKFLPDDITLDISELPEDSDGAPREKLGEGTLAYRRTIAASANVVHAFHRFARRSLALGAMIHEDFTDPSQTQVEGVLNVDGVVVPYKADFAAFDFDTDGDVDGSGNAVDEPVAVRIWTDRGSGFERFLCALVTTKPSSENLGAGQTYVHPDAADGSAYDDLQAFVSWDRTGEFHKWNEAVVSGQVRPFYALAAGRLRVDLRTYDDDHMEKTIRATDSFEESPYGWDSFKSAAHYRRGGEGLLISAEAMTDILSLSFSNICVNIVEHELAENGECDDFDLQDMTLLDEATADETSFPAAFPEAPTF